MFAVIKVKMSKDSLLSLACAVKGGAREEMEMEEERRERGERGGKVRQNVDQFLPLQPANLFLKSVCKLTTARACQQQWTHTMNRIFHSCFLSVFCVLHTYFPKTPKKRDASRSLRLFLLVSFANQHTKLLPHTATGLNNHNHTCLIADPYSHTLVHWHRPSYIAAPLSWITPWSLAVVIAILLSILTTTHAALSYLLYRWSPLAMTTVRARRFGQTVVIHFGGVLGMATNAVQ